MQDPQHPESASQAASTPIVSASGVFAEVACVTTPTISLAGCTSRPTAPSREQMCFCGKGLWHQFSHTVYLRSSQRPHQMIRTLTRRTTWTAWICSRRSPTGMRHSLCHSLWCQQRLHLCRQCSSIAPSWSLVAFLMSFKAPQVALRAISHVALPSATLFPGPTPAANVCRMMLSKSASGCGGDVCKWRHLPTDGFHCHTWRRRSAQLAGFRNQPLRSSSAGRRAATSSQQHAPATGIPQRRRRPARIDCQSG